MIISFSFMFHIWRYHRSNKPMNYRSLPEPNQRNVSIKLIIAVIVCITTLIVSIVFWASKKPEEYGMNYVFQFLFDSCNSMIINMHETFT